MAAHSSGMSTLVQEREDLMVSSSPTTPISRPAYFLTNSHNSISGSPVHPPPPQPVSNSDLDTPKESNNLLNFGRWNNPSAKWKEWVDLMSPKHQTLWKKSGILDAVLNSKYTIYRDDELLHHFASRWCSETNTFVFPWGEATLTLEDMMMLGGYSVVGDPVFRPVDTEELKAIETKLEHARLELVRTNAKKACLGAWLRKFMKSDNEIEHEAFLVYWLSRFVFPITVDSIVKCVIPIAIHLANGTKMALAPAVLASIYSDLNAYKIARLFNEQHFISSPFNLLQIWVWERFPLLQPKSVNVEPEEPSFAKWHGLKRNAHAIVTNVTDKVVDSFIWRPYTTICGKLSPSGIKEGKQQCLPVTSGTDEELEAVIKCIRVSELVGIDSECIEQYLPHRVARQFCLDQDIPTLVKRANSNQRLAWETYSRPVADKRFCIPSHLYEPNITVRYLEWWKKPLSAQDIKLETLPDTMILSDLKKRKLMNSSEKKPDDEVCHPAGTTHNAPKDCMTLRQLKKRARTKPEDKVCHPAGTTCNALKDCMTLRQLKKRARTKPEDKVCDPAGTTCNALKDCKALEDGMTLMELKERISTESARTEREDEDSSNEVYLENLESSEISTIGEGKNNLEHCRRFGNGTSYKRLLKGTALESVAQKQDDVLVPPGFCPSKCNQGSGRCSSAKNVEKESLCPQSTEPNARITTEEVVSRTLVEKISNNAKENEPCPCAKNVEKESLCPQPTHPNGEITLEEVVSCTLVEKISNHANEDEVRSVPSLSRNSLSELEARIFKVEENARITLEEVVPRTLVEKISNPAEENEPCLSEDALFDVEARIFNVEETLARYN